MRQSVVPGSERKSREVQLLQEPISHEPSLRRAGQVENPPDCLPIVIAAKTAGRPTE